MAVALDFIYRGVLTGKVVGRATMHDSFINRVKQKRELFSDFSLFLPPFKVECYYSVAAWPVGMWETWSVFHVSTG